jgi:hypothetical protein
VVLATRTRGAGNAGDADGRALTADAAWRLAGCSPPAASV